MKNLFIFCNSGWNIYNFRSNLIKKLNLIYSVRTISGKDKFSKKIKNLSESYNINLSSRSLNIYKNFQEIIKINNILKKHQKHILINFSNKSVIIGTLASFFLKNKIINVVTGLGSTFTSKSIIKKNIILLFYIIINFKTRYFVTQNVDDYKFFSKLLFISKKKIKLIKGSGIDENKFIPRKKKNKKYIIFLFIGRILKEKGIFNFLETAKYFEKKNKKIQFKIIGNYEKKYLNLTDQIKFKKLLKLKNLKYLKFRDNIIEQISNSDCVVLPSFREGLSRSLLEASLLERFIICSNVPGCRDIVKNNLNGFLVKSNNTLDLIDKVKKFLELSKSTMYKMEKMGRNRTLNLFTNKIILKKYLKLINDI